MASPYIEPGSPASVSIPLVDRGGEDIALSRRPGSSLSERRPDGSNLRPRASPAPGAYLAIVVTEIAHSSQLWELFPVATLEAVRIHDMIIRDNCREFEGYEAQATGDAFIVTFKTAKAALQFCLRVQTDLIAASWPPALSDSEFGKQVRDDEYNLIHRGLSVRMAIHWGEPIARLNDLTGRTEYIGPVVHRVTGAVEIALGGQIVVTDNFLNELEGAARNARKPMVHPKGLGIGLNGEEMEDGMPMLQNSSRAASPAPPPRASSSSSVAPRKPRQQAFAIKDTHRNDSKGAPLHLIAPASLSGRLKEKPKRQEAPQTGLSGWWEWAKEGVASNASEQNVLPI